MLAYFAERVQVARRKTAEWRARAFLQRQRELWNALNEYLEKTESTGCGLIDYRALYSEIRARRPLEVLECGTGVSTLVIAHGLMQNERDYGLRGRATSMEENEHWLDMSRRLLPGTYHPYVDFRYSDTVEDRFSLFRGVRYRDIPDRPYDFIFVDGPKYQSPEDGVPTFDFDAIHILRSADRPVSGLIDKRVSTCFVLQQILGCDKLRYSPVEHLGFLGPCTKRDLESLNSSLTSENFSRSFRLFGTTRLSMSASRH